MIKLLLIFLLPIYLISQNIWEMTDSRAGGVFETLECIDSNNCFATTRNGRVLYSSNQGQSWKILVDEKVVYRTRGWNDNAEFIDTNIFFLINWEGVIFSTRDGGKTFDSLDLRDDVEISWLKMFNENEGIAFVAVNYEVNPRFSFFYTQDSWKSWDTIDNWDNKKNGYTLQRVDIPFYHEEKLLFRYTEFIYSDVLQNTIFYNNIGHFDIENKYFSKYLEIPNKVVSPYYSKTKNNYFQLYRYSPSGKTTSYDCIIKYDFKLKKWKRVLELYFVPDPWGFRDIAFKNDSVGIAVGQFSKICYTYDAGESWYYEQEHNKFIIEENPPSMQVTFAGETAIITDLNKYIFRMTEDNLAPKPQDKLVISGYIKEDDKPQAEIPVELDNRYTMTDSNGYYQFIHIRPGKEYNLRVYNKYYSYTPYTYSPDLLKISITKDTTINFQATDKRIFHNVSGNVNLSSEGLPNIPILTIKEIAYHDRVYDTVKTNQDGFFHFDNIEDGFKYTFRPLSNEYTFEPSEYSFSTNGDRTGYLFTASLISSVIDNPNFQINNNILISKEINGLEYKIITLNGNIIESGILPKELNLNQTSNGTYILNITKGDKVVYTYKYQVVR